MVWPRKAPAIWFELFVLSDQHGLSRLISYARKFPTKFRPAPLRFITAAFPLPPTSSSSAFRASETERRLYGSSNRC